jgi:alpha-galactosidase
MAEISANRDYWNGDFYPLTPWTMSPSLWMAWQLHRPDWDAGIILAFRHEDSPYASMQVSLRGIKPERNYEVKFIDEQYRVTTKQMSGEKLAALELNIPNRHQSLLVRYIKLGK